MLEPCCQLGERVKKVVISFYFNYHSLVIILFTNSIILTTLNCVIHIGTSVHGQSAFQFLTFVNRLKTVIVSPCGGGVGRRLDPLQVKILICLGRVYPARSF